MALLKSYERAIQASRVTCLYAEHGGAKSHVPHRNTTRHVSPGEKWPKTEGRRRNRRRRHLSCWELASRRASFFPTVIMLQIESGPYSGQGGPGKEAWFPLLLSLSAASVVLASNALNFTLDSPRSGFPAPRSRITHPVVPPPIPVLS
ncbi:hypothetical protein MBM_07284 [Drepanopeziza brunnea f. sp. 'multigermtubi' MB_m1]|uniref:Uncharacterized protein n=1 Tax=Marssonina brunnea f. sp. multigermtubi (strain MB_m1) TaxID=1072389 RepID=K1X128_MARBU|nr:uncharacterized protein MBM_07284 [Drepanopeziza brunnea f. sp. 'multigermtubi' MB_m1]EKD14563.1 hypothetical protein MBM_07284 [Drepanopeziza brunnea f. sp. 'multigermtubi' MB_m1]